MKLSESQKKYLRGLGHALKPVVMIGDAGLTEGVWSEFNSCLEHHELIKVRVKVGDRQVRDSIIAALCDSGGAELVQRIGNMALLFRENPEKKKRIQLPR
jgi:RNA-binding protein